MHLQEIKKIFHKELDDFYSREEVDSFFYMLIEHFLKLERFVLALQPNLVITKEEEQPMFEALSKLRLHHPIQHIIGKAIFMDMDFFVDENVLIPRPETEELVRWIAEEVRGTNDEVRYKNEEGFKVLDIGTGSGCIAISLAKQLENAIIFALDISTAALEVAKKNAVLNAVKVDFFQEDIFKFESELKFDLIVSNPPYVRESEKSEMQQNVLNHEPKEALYVTDENPLLFYKAITQFAIQHLKPNGKLFFEINQYLGKETQQLLQDHNFSEIELRKDMFGNERMLKGVFNAAMV